MRPLAVVTGAGEGIGRATAHELAARGYTIVAAGRSAPRLHSLAAELGPPARAVVVDVSDPASVQAGFADTPPPRVVVVNAGICRQAGIDAPDADEIWSDVLAVNLSGPWHTVRALVPRMTSGGRVVFVSSGLGHRGRAAYSAYCASKHGLLGLMRALALELAPRGITVNAICPGWVDTRMAAADLEQTAAAQGTSAAEARRAATEAIPLGRFVAPAEVARLIAFLASDAAAAVTGQGWNIDAGESGT